MGGDGSSKNAGNGGSDMFANSQSVSQAGPHPPLPPHQMDHPPQNSFAGYGGYPQGPPQGMGFGGPNMYQQFGYPFSYGGGYMPGPGGPGPYGGPPGPPPPWMNQYGPGPNNFGGPRGPPPMCPPPGMGGPPRD